MTRKEEIIQTARQKEKEVGFSQFVREAKGVNSAYGIGFLEGTEWADEHPNELPCYKQVINNLSKAMEEKK